jgi:GNAT superfamily N-acetyltransferase
VARAADLDAVTDTLWRAFAEDPLWRWAFPEHDRLAPWWRFLVASAMRYPFVFATGGCAACSVWIPPDGAELTESEEAYVPELLGALIGTRAAEVLELLERFEAAHPRGRPHYYLSLLGTDPERRGEGLGMALLAENLAAFDEQGRPAYLESSNPENVPRYERLGFECVGEFSRPDGRLTVATMWREPLRVSA